MAMFKNNEEGVSAVIGVILMVAITVILAAVIAAFVFQLGNQMPSSGHQVGVQVSRINASAYMIKTMSGDTGLLDGARTYYVMVDGQNWNPATGTLAASQIGQASILCNLPAGAHDVTVIAHFTDGSNATAYSGRVA